MHWWSGDYFSSKCKFYCKSSKSKLCKFFRFCWYCQSFSTIFPALIPCELRVVFDFLRKTKIPLQIKIPNQVKTKRLLLRALMIILEIKSIAKVGAGWCGGPWDFSVSPKSKSLFLCCLYFVGLGALVVHGDFVLGLTGLWRLF